MSKQMLKGHEGVQVEIIGRLPTLFGLVRSEMAPDHPKTKGFSVRHDCTMGKLKIASFDNYLSEKIILMCFSSSGIKLGWSVGGIIL
ncbi:hypothetical protein BRADI_3g17216v3 [Brachypodium distachyon]|uniref:Uncharacterized protein n=1 Tax=Brachypodium distachyon TaxID=15368 RepID=A0A0Q3JAW5_BRADI|nr:hypothetical protein BRADI_3g17216v3 [Brachypodium distachyon]KQJ95440.1 hypothetical protein BRADI_3g17216v3 [Brachypodium distachyon]PNT66808.1 hypothetical protein BRADI_3g17216v3 [Brachypodium distachyon]